MPNITNNPTTAFFLGLLAYLISASSFMGFRSIAIESGVFVPQLKALEVVMVDPLAESATTTKRGAK